MCGRPVEKWGYQCDFHDPKGNTRKGTGTQSTNQDSELAAYTRGFNKGYHNGQVDADRMWRNRLRGILEPPNFRSPASSDAQLEELQNGQ